MTNHSWNDPNQESEYKVSDCCGVPIKGVMDGDEWEMVGVFHYMCMKCNKACNSKQQSPTTQNPTCKRCGLLKSTIMATGVLCVSSSTVNIPPHDFGEQQSPAPKDTDLCTKCGYYRSKTDVYCSCNRCHSPKKLDIDNFLSGAEEAGECLERKYPILSVNPSKPLCKPPVAKEEPESTKDWESLMYKGSYSGSRETAEAAGSHGAEFFLLKDVRSLITRVRQEAVKDFAQRIDNDFDNADEEDWKCWEVGTRVNLLRDAYLSSLTPTPKEND